MPAATSTRAAGADATSLRILGRANSFNVRKVLWACDETGIGYVREDYGRGFRACTEPAFLALNPVAQVPVVIDNGVVMRESNSVVRYLAAKAGREDLYPSNLVDRQRVEQWMDWIAYDLTHALRGAFLGGMLKEAPWNNDWFVNQGRKDLIHDMRIVEAHLAANGPYVTGATFTVADIAMGLVVNRWFKVDGFDKPETPALAAYYELLSQRPAYLAHGRNGLP
ncbi:MAG: glutathione S-transferase family protein [Rhodospirillales bacterium CG15_BIG_FIL_POST_REV_8_21_14_020_66_15]|nr:MAG: glutathione S-transferase family protein [Rhodospirillales bacterium CG15_BIG_FIL_POST_REV_8_21_14_020_66_15]